MSKIPHLPNYVIYFATLIFSILPRSVASQNLTIPSSLKSGTLSLTTEISSANITTSAKVCPGNISPCQLAIGTVYVTHWAVLSSNTACLTDPNYGGEGYGSGTTWSEPLPATNLGNFRNDSVTTVVGSDGFTYTSPSVYLIIPTVSAIDTCGNITGRVFTSVTFSFAPGELSTGGERGPNTAPFNFYDYPCPLPSEVWSPYVWQFGEPYRPQIVPPPQLFDLDPVFTSCFLYPGDCFDPPYALTPVSSLSPFTPSVSIASSASTPAPGPKPKSPGPAPTSVDVKGKPDITYTSATSAVSSPLTLVSTPASISSDVDDSKSAITTSSALEVPSSTTSSAGTPIDSSKDPDSTIRDNTAVSSLTIFPSDVQHPSSGDSIIKTSNSVTKTSNVVAPVILPTGAALTIDGEIITLQPTMFSIGSQMLSQGGPAITLSNTLLSLGSAGLVVGTTESILLGQALEFTIDDQTFTAVPSGLLADGETILPDQPGVTINDGNIIASLGPDDGDIIVVDGGSTTTIPVAQVTSIGLGGVIMSGFAPVGTPERTAVVTSSSTAANGTVIFSTGRSSKTIDTCALQWRRLSLVAIGLAWMYIYSE